MAEETRACILCRGVKVECVNDGDYNTPCARCTRLNLTCAYSRKRRNVPKQSHHVPPPRCADSSIIAPAPAPALTGSSDSPPQHQQASSPTASDSRDPSVAAQHVSNLQAVVNPERSAPVVVQGNGTDSQLSSRRRDTSSAASPAEQLLTCGSTPASSQTNYRTAAHTDVTRLLDPGEDRNSVHMAGLESSQGKVQEPSDDPVSAGYITNDEANRLVMLFHEHLNEQISLLDPDLHTYDYLRKTNTVLFSAVLAASCKYFREESYPLFVGRAQRLLSAAVEVGRCHIGILQAALILVYWKQPTDQSAWVKIGVAIRLAYQLGLHQLRMDEGLAGQHIDRERLNEERTWFCLAAFDYTYSGLFNLPPTIRSYDIGDCENWARGHGHLTISAFDLALAASLDYILLTFLKTQRTLEGCDRSLALMELEERYHKSRSLTQKWCGTPSGERSVVGGQKFAAIRMSMLSTTLAIRVQMLGYMQTNEGGEIVAECLELAVAIVKMLQALQVTLHLLQDALSVRLAVFGTCMQTLYWRFSNPQRRLGISLLTAVYDICRATSKDEQDTAAAFVARFFEKILRTLNTASKAFSRHPSPSAPGTGQDGDATASTEPAALTGLDTPLPNAVDETVLHDLSLFLENDNRTGTSTFSAFDEQYWTSLTTSISFDWWEDNFMPQ